MELITSEESKKLTDAAKTVKENAYLTLDVYIMQLTAWERKSDKNGNQYLRASFDTGYKTKEGAPRMLNNIFYLQGTYPDGREKIDDLARFLKVCFAMKAITTENLKATIGKNLSVATKKDAEGYIQFWYAESAENFKKTRANYTPKNDTSNFHTYGQVKTSTPAATEQPSEPDFLANVSIPEPEAEEDDLPFNKPRRKTV
jgi:hypothetical protein